MTAEIVAARFDIQRALARADEGGEYIVEPLSGECGEEVVGEATCEALELGRERALGTRKHSAQHYHSPTVNSRRPFT